MIVGFLLTCIIGLGIIKWKNLQLEAIEAKSELNAEKVNNQVLTDNLKTVATVNKANILVIRQLEADQKKVTVATAALRSSVARSTQAIDEAKTRLATIDAPPVLLSPYIIDALESIQRLRAPIDDASPKATP